MSQRDPPRYPKPDALTRIPEGRHAVIEASAGTGKTFIIEHLVVDLIVTHDVPLDEILVVTFTEKAANALKRRIRAKLQELLDFEETTTVNSPKHFWSLDSGAKSRIDRALMDFDTASISTIHAFCHRVVGENAFLGGRRFTQEHVDERTIFGRAFKDVLRTKLARDDELLPYLTAWLEERGSTVDALEKLLFRADQARALLGPSFDAERLAATVERLPDTRLTFAQLVDSRIHRGSVDKVLRELGTVRDAILGYLRTKNIATLIARLEKIDLDYLSSKLTAFGKLSRALRELDDASAALSAALVERFLPLVQERLAREKRERGLFDFRDMLVLVERALSGPGGSELARMLRARYRCALFDEFQDTDEVQWNIFRKVFFENDTLDSSMPSRLVGDPKQAIYGFRGADVHVYLRAKSDLESRGAVVPLIDNFRSTPELIDCLNHIFDQRVEQPFFTGDISYDIPVRAGAADVKCIDVNGAPIFPLVLVRSARKDTLLDRIANEIQALVQQPARQLRFGSEGDERPLAPEDIFVLTRTAREADEVGEALAIRGVAHAFYKRDGLFASREAEDVRSLFEALANPHDRSKRYRAWMTSFFELSLAELENAASSRAADPWMTLLTEWESLARARDFEALFPRILDDSGVLCRELFRGRGERASVNLVHLFDLLLEEVGRTGAALPDLLRSLDRYISGAGLPPGADSDTMRLEADRAVQIMTMHMSKGLEAGIVFLYAFSSGDSSSVHGYYDRGERRAHVGALSRAPDDVGRAVRRERREEEQRLLYVAVTRAKARLYLPWIPGAAQGLGCYLQMNRRLDEAHDVFEILDAVRPTESTEDDIVTGEERASGGNEEALVWTPPIELTNVPDSTRRYDELRVRNEGLVVTSYSRMKNLRGGYRQPIEEPGDLEELPIPMERLPAGRAVGIFLHEVMERIDFEVLASSPSFQVWRSDPDVSELFRYSMRRNGIDPRFRTEAEALVHNALTSPIDFGGGRLDKGFVSLATERREVDFVYPYPEIDAALPRGFVKGAIDLVFELDSRTFFCDFKSDTLSAFDASVLEAHVRRNYQLQAKLYTLALVKMLEVEDETAYDARFGGLIYCFLRGMPDGGVYYERPSWQSLTEWRSELARETRI